MEGNIEESDNFLSQSYCNGIQKLTGNEKAIPYDFHIPTHLLETRKKDWEKLFAKYSVEELEEDIEMDIYVEEEGKPEPRMPMRKPMSMVQYWVDTGSQPYLEKPHNKSQLSDSCSSLSEESLGSVNGFKNLNGNFGLEKNRTINDDSPKKQLQVISSSSSSVDTAAYILANNNTTKKADAIAIVEGSKATNKEASPTKLVTDLKNGNYRDTYTQNNKIQQSSKMKLANKEANTKTSREDIESIDNSNHRNANIDKIEINDDNVNCRINTESDNSMTACDNEDKKEKSDSNTNSDDMIYNSHIQFDKSPGKHFEVSLMSGNQTAKPFKRKKLYNSSESPADFTPISDDNFSQKKLKISSTKCEHPALQTPMIPSRFSFATKTKRYKKRQNRRTLFSLMAVAEKQLDKGKLSNINENSEDLNSSIASDEKSKENTISSEEDIQEDSENNSQICKVLHNAEVKNNDCPETNTKLLEINKEIDDIEKTFNDKFMLKPVLVEVKRLPYKYNKSPAETNFSHSVSPGKEKNVGNSLKIQENKSCKTKLNSGSRENNTLSKLTISDSEDDIINIIDDLFRKPCKIKKHDSKSPDKVLLGSKSVNSGSSTANDNLTNQSKGNLQFEHKSTVDNSVNKYVLVISSSDESEGTVSDNLKDKSKRNNSSKRRKKTKQSLESNGSVNKSDCEEKSPENKKQYKNRTQKSLATKLKENIDQTQKDIVMHNFELVPKLIDKNNEISNKDMARNPSDNKVDTQNKEMNKEKPKRLNKISIKLKRSVDDSNNENFKSSKHENKLNESNGKVKGKKKELDKLHSNSNKKRNHSQESSNEENIPENKNVKSIVNEPELGKSKKDISKTEDSNLSSKEEKISKKERKINKNKSEFSLARTKKKTEIVFSSDDECIIPISMKVETSKDLQNTNDLTQKFDFTDFIF